MSTQERADDNLSRLSRYPTSQSYAENQSRHQHGSDHFPFHQKSQQVEPSIQRSNNSTAKQYPPQDEGIRPQSKDKPESRLIGSSSMFEQPAQSQTASSSSQGHASITAHRHSCPQPRQNRMITFVSSNGLPPFKRKRIQTACKACRRRKVRCSGEKPVCRTCSDHGHVCDGYAASRSCGESSTMQEKPVDKTGNKSRYGPASEYLSQSSSPIGATATSEMKRRKPNTAPTVLNTLSGTKSDAGPSNSANSLSHTHVPYFRYFGPTAIVPGYKQTVVQVREPRRSLSLSLQSQSPTQGESPDPSSRRNDVSLEDSFYSIDDDREVSDLVLHLCDIFFVHFGCSFPFLQRERFFANLIQKKVEPILVDAVCAVSARFSLHPLLLRVGEGLHGLQKIDHKKATWNSHVLRGQAFAHRAMTAVVESLECPTIAVVQACLLVAYEQFGSNKDSGLWNYLGIAIRMAQDLGIQKVKGLKYRYGRLGLRPKDIRCGLTYDNDGVVVAFSGGGSATNKEGESFQGRIEGQARERERVDTFWSIFFLDRVIASGTGRPVTLLDGDIEIAFPMERDSLLDDGLPSPFPMLLRVIHLYGRITDLLNGIEESSYISSATLERLMNLEKDLTGIYQLLCPELHFNVVNFQKHVKAGEGTNFLLLHFWFHTIIVLLHQPTLLHSFGGQMQQLVPNAKELSISSAKTIVDILAFAELIDAKSFIGNPFTSQPIYIAACAFLVEQQNSNLTENHPRELTIASSPQENYQKCYEALKRIKVYWEGCKYILTVLDQKAKGIVDPQLYTVEEWDETAVQEEVERSLPGSWMSATMSTSTSPFNDDSNRRTSSSEYYENEESVVNSLALDNRQTAGNLASRQAIGWALTGAIGAEQPNVSFLYQIPTEPTQPPSPVMQYRQLPSTRPRVAISSELDSLQRIAPSSMRYHESGRHGNQTPSSTMHSSQHLGACEDGHPNIYSHSDSRHAPRKDLVHQRNYLHHTYSHDGRDMPSSVPPLRQEFSTSTVPIDVGATVNIGMQDIDMTYLHHNHQNSAEKGEVGCSQMTKERRPQQHQQAPSIAIGSQLIPLLDYLPADVLNYFEMEHGNEHGAQSTNNPSASPGIS